MIRKLVHNYCQRFVLILIKLLKVLSFQRLVVAVDCKEYIDKRGHLQLLSVLYRIEDSSEITITALRILK